jgi:NIPSNAP
MLTRRLPRCPSTLSSLSSTALRPSRTYATKRAPALADIQPEQPEPFNERQKAFRERLKTEAEDKKRQEQEESRSKAAAAAAAAAAASASEGAQHSSKSSSSLLGSTLGSLSSSFAEEARLREDAVSGKKAGAFSTLIYGTQEGREMDREIERSFSQVLARGKYVHSIVFHEVKPDKVDEYVALVGGWYPKVAAIPEMRVNLVGSWRTEVGDCDTFGKLCGTNRNFLLLLLRHVVHIWEYHRYNGYHGSLHAIQAHPEFPEFDRKLKTLIHSKHTSLMQEFSFWPTTPPRQLGGLFELRSYTLHPGNLLEWETHWRRGLKARREVMEGVGAWFVQIGDLNVVHHLWQFADLEERKLRRERSWQIEGWGETVHKTVPLIQQMKSRIMVPLAWSPVA